MMALRFHSDETPSLYICSRNTDSRQSTDNNNKNMLLGLQTNEKRKLKVNVTTLHENLKSYTERMQKHKNRILFTGALAGILTTIKTSKTTSMAQFNGPQILAIDLIPY